MIQSAAMQLWLVCGVALGLVACADTADMEPAPTRTTHQAAEGTPVEYAYATHQERVVLYLTNRARTQPDKYNPASPYPPTPPLRYHKALSEAARFHAEQVTTQDCWCEDHSSCCEVGKRGDDFVCLTPSGACGAMSADARVQLWTTAYSGENMARGYATGAAAIDGWISSPGHWANINSGQHGLLGVGQHNTSWVQDFGRPSGAPPVAADGIHFEDGGGTRFGITYYQPGTGGPREVIAVVDGQCHTMALVAGEAEHGAFEASLSLDPGCHRYYFYVRDGQGADHVWPEVGSLGAGKGDGACALWSENRPAESCTPAGQTCTTGDTRMCYTGPFGTKGIGQCVAGVERCVGAVWQGECRLEVLPGEEVCGGGVDEDCDGEVDEGCQVAPTPDMGGDEDLGAADQGVMPTPGGSTGDDGGCASAQAGPQALWTTLMGCMGVLALVRRRVALRGARDPKRDETR